MEQEIINHKYNTRSKKRQLDTGGNTPTQKNSKAKFHRTISDNEIENENYTKSTFKLDLDKLPKIISIKGSSFIVKRALGIPSDKGLSLVASPPTSK